MSEDAISMLVALGFSAEKASEAYRVCDGNADAAANLLFSSGSSGGGGAVGNPGQQPTTISSSPSSSGRIEMVNGPISQYSLEDGRSACTCIALTGAERFIHQASNVTAGSLKLPDAAFLQHMITAGVATYQKMRSEGANSVEHMSAEEVLQKGLFSTIRVDGVRQGMLSHTYPEDDSQGLRRMLLDAQQTDTWCCCLITKPPETVMVCLPPKQQGAAASPDEPLFILMDSHPRPQFGAEEAYARIHTNLDGLLNSLQTLFPPTDLGPDVAPIMAAMYNAFDLYVLVQKGN